MRTLFVSFISLLCVIQASGLNSKLVQADSTSLPKVFILGQHESAYEKLFEKHSTVLLEACDDDMDVAFDKWLSMLKEMEAYANSIEYDIKGIKVWLNIFWDKKGKIKHIAYHLKVNSRNVDLNELTAFFSSFMNHYNFPLVTDRNFSHYGGVSFPTFAQVKADKGKDKGKDKDKDKDKEDKSNITNKKKTKPTKYGVNSKD